MGLPVPEARGQSWVRWAALQSPALAAPLSDPLCGPHTTLGGPYPSEELEGTELPKSYMTSSHPA